MWMNVNECECMWINVNLDADVDVDVDAEWIWMWMRTWTRAYLDENLDENKVWKNKEILGVNNREKAWEQFPDTFRKKLFLYFLEK